MMFYFTYELDPIDRTVNFRFVKGNGTIDELVIDYMVAKNMAKLTINMTDFQNHVMYENKELN